MNDYIRTYLGLLGSGKTTQALNDIRGLQRVLVYSPGTTHPEMLKLPWITDEEKYLSQIHKFLQMHPRLRVEKRANPSRMFQILSGLRGVTVLCDDVAALKTHPQERADFEAFCRTVRYNGNQIVLTTHRARKDLPPLIHNIGTSFYYVGPGTRSRKELEALHDLTNYPISLDEFTNGLINNPARSGGHSAGIFPIRRAI